MNLQKFVHKFEWGNSKAIFCSQVSLFVFFVDITQRTRTYYYQKKQA